MDMPIARANPNKPSPTPRPIARPSSTIGEVSTSDTCAHINVLGLQFVVYT